MKNLIPKEAIQYLGIGVQFAVTILVGVFLGHFLDGKFQTTPWCTLAGAAFGLILGFIELIKKVQ